MDIVDNFPKPSEEGKRKALRATIFLTRKRLRRRPFLSIRAALHSRRRSRTLRAASRCRSKPASLTPSSLRAGSYQGRKGRNRLPAPSYGKQETPEYASRRLLPKGSRLIGQGRQPGRRALTEEEAQFSTFASLNETAPGNLLARNAGHW